MIRNTLILTMTLTFSHAQSFAEPAIGTPDRDDIEYPNDEPPSAAEVELGKTLYFDTRLSKNLNQSCATCHNPDLGFGDGKAFGLSTHGKKVGRNAPHIYNLAFATTFMWDGRFATFSFINEIAVS